MIGAVRGDEETEDEAADGGSRRSARDDAWAAPTGGGSQEFRAGAFRVVKNDKKFLRGTQMAIDKRPVFLNAVDAGMVTAVASLFLAVILDFSKSSGSRDQSGLT
jgi:hypothetical protein